MDNYTLIDEEVHQEDTTTYSGTFLEYESFDDGVYNVTGMYNTEPTTDDMRLYYTATGMWFRFSEINIPKNAKITNVALQLYVEDRYTGEYYATPAHACFQRSATPPLQITSEEDFNSREKTIEHFDFYFNTTDPATLNYTSILQELVSMPDWQEENNTVLIMLYTDHVTIGGSQESRYRVRTYDYDTTPYSTNSPKLYVEYQLPGGASGEYITSSGIDIKDTYNLNTVSGISDIKAISHNIFSKRGLDRANHNDMGIVPLTLISGTTYSGTYFLPQDIKYTCINYIEDSNPHTNDTWLLTDFSTNEFGFTTISG